MRTLGPVQRIVKTLKPCHLLACRGWEGHWDDIAPLRKITYLLLRPPGRKGPSLSRLTAWQKERRDKNNVVGDHVMQDGSQAKMPSDTPSNPYKLRKHGQPRTEEFRVFLEKNGTPISLFHDIPLYADKENQIFNMIVEVPRWTNEKYEVSTRLVHVLKPAQRYRFPGQRLLIRFTKIR